MEENFVPFQFALMKQGKPAMKSRKEEMDHKVKGGIFN